MITSVSLQDLRCDFSLYPRAQLNEANVDRLREAFRAGCKLPPIVACRTSLRVVDGWHRHKVLTEELGPQRQVEVELLTYSSDSELFAAAVALNSKHGQPLSPLECVHIIKRAGQLGLKRDHVAAMLKITVVRVDSLCGQQHSGGWKQRSSTPATVPVPRPSNPAPAAPPKRESQDQFGSGVVDALAAVNTVIQLLETRVFFDLRNKQLVTRMNYLQRLWEELA